MIRPLRMLALFALPAAAVAQEAENGRPPSRIRNLYLSPGEECPKPASQDEVVVCAPADPEQYRIPKQFRNEPVLGGPSTAWNVRARNVIDDQRRTIPGSCSPVGTAGQSGCGQLALERWAAERGNTQDGPAPR